MSGRKLELRPGTDEVTVRGELQVLSSSVRRIEADWVSQVIPYEGKLLCNGLTEGMFYSVEHTLEDTLVDIRMDEDGEMRILGIEGTLLLRMELLRRAGDGVVRRYLLFARAVYSGETRDGSSKKL